MLYASIKKVEADVAVASALESFQYRWTFQRAGGAEETFLEDEETATGTGYKSYTWTISQAKNIQINVDVIIRAYYKPVDGAHLYVK